MLFRIIVIAILLAYAHSADAQERVIMAGLGGRMASVYNEAPDECKWEVRSGKKTWVITQSFPGGGPNPLVWWIDGIRYASGFKVRLACRVEGWSGLWSDWSPWSEWSDWVYAGPENDLTGDGVMGIADLSAFKAAWRAREGDTRYNAAADFDHNGVVGVSDYTMLRSVWGRTKVGNLWEKQ